MKAHFSLLDFVRFFAAFWVMNFHYFQGNSADVHWYRYGNLGVQLFFIISGFVIVESLKGKTLKEFAVGRFIRLFPLFWILCTLTYIVTFIIPHTNTAVFSDYMKSMTMFGNIFNGFVGSTHLIDPSYWTLTIEVIFYTAIGIFVSLFSYKNIRYFFTGWLIISALAFWYHVDHNFYTKLLLVSHAPYFVFGGALAFLVTKQATTVYEKYFDWVLLFVSSIYATCIHPLALDPYEMPNPQDSHIVSMLLIVFFVAIPALVYLSRFIKTPWIISVLTILGGITYPLYLLHQTIGNALINYGTSLYDISWGHFAVGFEIFIIAIAYIAYIEDIKLRAWLKKVLL